MELKDIREEEARKLRDKIAEEGALSMVEELLKDNKIEFEVQNQKYRVRLLTLKEKEELDTLKRKKFGELLKDKTILLQSELIEEYKNRGINLDELDEKMSKIDADILDKKIKLGESIAKNEAETFLKTYEQEIDALMIEQEVLRIRKNLFLELCLENKLLMFIAQVISYLSLEIYLDDKWQRLFKSFEDYEKCENDELLNKAGVASIALHYA